MARQIIPLPPAQLQIPQGVPQQESVSAKKMASALARFAGELNQLAARLNGIKKDEVLRVKIVVGDDCNEFWHTRDCNGGGGGE